ncbi:MAG: hypothetical protein HDQ89_07710 [Desulfovibrio sp.]|nr:hypothetical protein [Desulfovibrio sp.]
MSSSISNFKKIIITALLLIISFGLFKLYYLSVYSAHNQPIDKYFWIQKTHAKQIYDVIAVGDSRVYRGLSPAEMSKELGNVKIHNFGYRSAGFGLSLIDAAVKKLRPTGEKIIILGITPHSLTRTAATNSHFRECKAQFPYPTILRYLEKFFGSHTTRASVMNLFDKQNLESAPYEFAHSDGWAECIFPLNPEVGIPIYQKRFSKNKVDGHVTEALLKKVNELSRSGYKVFGYRPPTFSQMEELENSCSGFDEGAFIRAFEAAGGQWIPLDDRFSFDSYDGSHLVGSSARKLSRELGKKIQERLRK